MQVRVLGCSGSIAQGSRTTSFLVDDDVLVDAGTGVGDLPLAELATIDHILLSHSHLDHILSIPLLADAVARVRRASGRPPIKVHALPQTLSALRQHVFNGIIWPDFTALPHPSAPALTLHPIEIGQTLKLGRREFHVLPAQHTVPAVGFAARTDSRHPWWVYTGDTGPNPALWCWLADEWVSALVIETAFSDEEQDVAKISQHLCPAQLRKELSQLTRPTPVFITHIKPGETERVMTQVQSMGLPHPVRALFTGQQMRIEADVPKHVAQA